MAVDNPKHNYIKDLIGSTRAVVDENGTTENRDYYPFGLLMDERQYVQGTETTEKFSGKERDQQTGFDYFGARYYMPGLGRWISTDPMEQYASPYVYTGNNPINFADPTGLFSTHTDSSGNVLAVYDDGDKGVYRHEEKTTKEEVDEKHSEDNTSAGGQKMGETEYIDEFATFDKKGNVQRNKDGSLAVIPGAKIHFGTSWHPILEMINKTSQRAGLLGTAILSYPNMPFDIKSKAENGTGTGRLLNGKYATAQSAGNYVAGKNASSLRPGVISVHEWYQITILSAGILHAATNNSTVSTPYAGELPHVGRRIIEGFYSNDK